MSKSLRASSGLFILILILTCFYSCKKTDKPADATLAAHEKAVAAMKERIKIEGQVQVLASNVKANSFLFDEVNGRIIEKAAGILACDDGNGDPIYGFDETVLESCSRSFLCGSGYKVRTSWLLTTELPLLTTGSKGRLRLKNSSGTIVYTNTNITPVSITGLGQTNSNFPNSTVYRVEYETDFIDQTTYQSAETLENGVLIQTNCSRVETVNYLASYSLFIGGTSSAPCLRIDRVYVNPPSSGVLGSVAGCNAFGQCNISGYTVPNDHDIEFIPISGGAAAKTITLAYWEVKSVATSSANPLPADISTTTYIRAGTYQIRYRNKHTGCTGSWSVPTTNITF